MNKQRKVVITTTYNEMGTIIDTKAEEVAQPSVEPKPVITEEVREAITRLTMCAREECSICKCEKTCGFDKQVEMATKNMNTIINAFTERPKGEWVKAMGVAPPEYAGRYVCSNCGHYALMNMPYGSRQELSPFCPNCGAMMKGADDE